MVAMGWAFRRLSWINDGFVEAGSKIVFNVALPALLYLKISQADLSKVLDWEQVGFALVATLCSFVLVWGLSGRSQMSSAERGVYIQGAFRGNLGIVGIALCGNMYGDQGLVVGSMLLAFMTLLYNVLSVFALSSFDERHPQQNWGKVIVSLFKNPLIISICLALVANVIDFSIPTLIETSLDYFSGMTLPLALICVGASINSKVLKQSGGLSIKASFYKLVWSPLLFTAAAIVMGFEGLMLGTLFLMMASPTAAASYVMAKAMHGDAELAATIIAMTTAFSIVSVSVGVFSLRALGLA